MAEFASNGKANAGLTTGIIGTALSGLLTLGSGALGGGGVMPLGGVRNYDSSNSYITRYEMEIENKLQDALQKNALLEANIYTDRKLADVYERLDGKIRANENAIAQQAVLNATENANLVCIQSQLAQLQSLTKMIIPISNVCPQPMPKFNSWTAPTTEATA